MNEVPRTDAGGGALPTAAAIVPARLGSTRMPRKMLRRETGRYLFEHTVRNARRSPALTAVWVATDAEEILAAAEEVGIDAVLTSSEHPSGTDRVHEAYRTLRERGAARDWDVIINVQGDEPELPLADLAALVDAFRDPAVEMATLWAPLERDESLDDPNVVKVVCDLKGYALYFSRSPIPSRVHPSRPPREGAIALRETRRHVGVYAFRPAALERFCGLPVGRLEATESLEQLRWLENGGRLLALPASRVTRGIDTEEDYAAFASRH